MPFFLLGKSASRASNNAKTLDLHYNYHDKKNTKIQNPKSHQVLDHQGSGAVHPAQLGAEPRARIDAEGLAAVDAGGRGETGAAVATAAAFSREENGFGIAGGDGIALPSF